MAQEPAHPEHLCPGFLCQAMPSARFLTLVLERKLKIAEMELNGGAQLVGRHLQIRVRVGGRWSV